MNTKFLLLLMTAFQLVVLYSCTDHSVDYSRNPGDVLAFSADTIAFDTILSSVNTPTRGFIVYNPNPKPLLISSIALSGGKQSGFNINVDGVAGTAFENVEIGANDSLYVFVNAKLEDNNAVSPVLYLDYIVFTTNSNQQRVVLQAYGQDAYIWRGKIIETSEMLPNDKPYLIYDSLEIKEGVTLTLQEGTVFYMHPGASIQVRGTLIAQGAMDKRIVIRGDRMDHDYMVNIPYDRVPGQWGGIRFAETSFDNELDYVWIRNGSYGLSFDSSDPERLKLKIKNSVVTNVTGNLIVAENCHIEGENCEFSNSRYALLQLAGGKYRFVHCTLANCYPSVKQWQYSVNPTVTLSNKTYATDAAGGLQAPVAAPLLQADFMNSIIWSPNLQSGKIQLQPDTDDFPDTPFNCHFHHCLLLHDGINDDRFTACVFNENPLFVNTSLTDDEARSIPYDFRLDSMSLARGIADPLIAQELPVDMNGISRIQDESADPGAYQYHNE
ncbi:MAG: hypothetical protein LBR67_03250 [Dysgonamonadaceae bacterium]|nr:hypothetical protein [Dysgonamonadaceae bacterium]